jgi:hypothetical protein
MFPTSGGIPTLKQRNLQMRFSMYLILFRAVITRLCDYPFISGLNEGITIQLSPARTTACVFHLDAARIWHQNLPAPLSSAQNPSANSSGDNGLQIFHSPFKVYVLLETRQITYSTTLALAHGNRGRSLLSCPMGLNQYSKRCFSRRNGASTNLKLSMAMAVNPSRTIIKLNRLATAGVGIIVGIQPVKW